jgi:CHAT domain
MSIREQNELLERLIATLQALEHQVIAIARKCRVQRRPDREHGFVMTIAPTPEEQAVAATLRRRLSLWQAAVVSVLTRRGIVDRTLDRTLEIFARLVELKYVRPMTMPAPRVRAAFEEAIRVATIELGQRLHEHRSLFRLRGPRVKMRYEPFSLRIAPVGTQWTIEASYERQRAIEVSDALFTADEVEQLLTARLAAARGIAREASPQQAESLANTGAQLFRTVFTGSVGTLYERARTAALLHNAGLRVELDVVGRLLSAIPWELLHDGLRFLGLTRDVALVRRIAGRPVAHVESDACPLRMLLTISSPRDLVRIDAERERQTVEQAVAPLVVLERLQLDVAPDGSMKTVDRLLAAARREGYPYQVWHLAAHGRYDAQSQRGALAMTAADGTAHWVGAAELTSLCGDDPQLRLVVLSSCHGAEGNTQERWSAIASAFLCCGGEAVVAQHLEISHAAAKALASELYGALADGSTVEEAVAAGRRGIFDLPNYTEWVRPVLFRRGEVEASRATGI